MKPRQNSLAVIPARGNSQRIARKNIRLFQGKPIIEYAIAAALDSGIFAEVMVSTDDTEIAEIAKKAGARVPFLRSQKTSNALASMNDALIEVLGAYQKIGRSFDYFGCIMATAALVTPARLKQADALMLKHDADSVVAVTRFEFPIQRALKFERGRLLVLDPKSMRKRSQDIENAYHDCGQFFFCKTKTYLVDKHVFNNKTFGLEIPRSQAQDIDTEEDWQMAELKYDLMRRCKA